MTTHPGKPTRRPMRVLLMGSGETAPSGRRMHERMLDGFKNPVRMAVLETPAGFELNSEAVAQRVGNFFKHSLQNFNPKVSVVPARRKDGPFSTNDAGIASPIDAADYMFLGPGSPTYLVRHLADSIALEKLTRRLRRGATLCLASAAAISFGAFALPVYEIFKAGADVHWKDGLDFFGIFGLKLAIVWNNNEGGEVVDTSRCFMGEPRMDELLPMLPKDAVAVGIDEYTGLSLDLLSGQCQVMGLGGVTIIKPGLERPTSMENFTHGSTFPIGKLGPFSLPQDWTAGDPAVEDNGKPTQIPEEVLTALKEREQARKAKDFGKSDELRKRINALGFEVKDTPSGQEVVPNVTDSPD